METATPLPFRTQNAVLAFSLYMAGVPEWIPPTNSYDEEILRQLGYRGMELEEAAKTAFEKQERGHVEYWFERTPEMEFLLKAYEDQEGIVKAEGTPSDGGEAAREIMRQAAGRPAECAPGETPKPAIGSSFPMDEREALLRLVCVAIKLRPLFINRWKEPASARLRIPAPGSEKELSRTASSRTVQYPGMKSIPLFSSDKLKADLGVA